MKTSALLLGLALAACDAPTDPQASEQGGVPAQADESQVSDRAATTPNPVVGPGFGGGTLNWTRIGSLLYRYTAIERNGEVVICGAFTGRGSSNVRSLSREAMRQATVTVNDQTILRNLRFFAETSNSTWDTQLEGVETNCSSTGQSADGIQLNSVRVELREGRYRVRL